MKTVKYHSQDIILNDREEKELNKLRKEAFSDFRWTIYPLLGGLLLFPYGLHGLNKVSRVERELLHKDSEYQEYFNAQRDFWTIDRIFGQGWRKSIEQVVNSQTPQEKKDYNLLPVRTKREINKLEEKDFEIENSINEIYQDVKDKYYQKKENIKNQLEKMRTAISISQSISLAIGGLGILFGGVFGLAKIRDIVGYYQDRRKFFKKILKKNLN